MTGSQGGFGPASAQVTPLTPGPEGGWCWFTEPRAIHHDGTIYFGYVNARGDVIVRSYDPATRALSPETVLHAALQVDDHSNPSFLVRASDRRILAFYTAHDDTTMRLRISTDPDDVSAFGPEARLDAALGGTAYDYANPFQQHDEPGAPIHLFYRDVATPGAYDLVSSTSQDGGLTWAAQQRLVHSGRRSYWKTAANRDGRIDVAFIDVHPAHGDGSLYHFSYAGGAAYRSDGSPAGLLPIGTSGMTLIHAEAASKAWVHDIAVQDGHPVIAYVTFPTPTDHRYRHARWTGSAWQTSEIVAAGSWIPTAIVPGAAGIEEFYSGGMALDQSDPSIVYCSVQVGPERWDILRCVTDDGGRTWRATTLTRAGKNIRPAAVRDATSDLRALFLTGSYASYTSYNVGISGIRG